MVFPGAKEAIEAVLKWIDSHFSFRYFVMFFILSIAFLFGVNPLLAALGLPPIPVGYRVVAASLSIITGAGALFFSFERGCVEAKKFWQIRQTKEQIRRHFEHLPFDQVEVLRQYTGSGKSTVKFQPDNGAVRDLVRRGVLYPSSNQGTLFDGFPYTITPIAEDFLRREEFQKLTLKRKS